MSSETPWLDARAKIEAANLGYPVSWPNEPFDEPEPPAPFLVVEMAGDVLAPVELGPEAIWQENGTLYVHVMVPVGTGSLLQRQIAKQVVNIFRGLPPAAVRYYNANVGLGAPADEDGNYARMSVCVDYKYQDAPTS